jgi:hypothetical protein
MKPTPTPPSPPSLTLEKKPPSAFLAGSFGHGGCHCLAGWIMHYELTDPTLNSDVVHLLLNKAALQLGFIDSFPAAEEEIIIPVESGHDLFVSVQGYAGFHLPYLNDHLLKDNEQRAAVWNLAVDWYEARWSRHPTGDGQ